MNSANNRSGLKSQTMLPVLALALYLAGTVSVQATAPAPVPAPTPTTALTQLAPPAPEGVAATETATQAPAAVSADTPDLASAPEVSAAAAPEEAKAIDTDAAANEGEKKEPEVAAIPETQAVDPQEVLAMLRSGNGGKPLTVTQLAAINDMLKRMEFLSQVETKMRDINKGLISGGSTPTTSLLGGGPNVSNAPRTPGGPSAPGGVAGGGLTVVRIVGVGGKFSATLTNGTGQTTVREGDSIDIGQVQRIGVNGVTVLGSGGLVTLPFSSTAAFAGVSFNR